MGITAQGRAFSPVRNIEGFNENNSVTYDVETDSFRLRIANALTSLDETFLPTDIDPRSDASLTVYEGAGGDRMYVMLNAQEAILNLNYVTFGNWIDTTGDNNDLATGYVVFGVRTPVSAMPGSGTASYAGQTAGTMVDAKGNVYTVSGFGTLTANFTAGTVNGDFNRMGALAVQTATVVPWRDFTTTADISGSSFTGSAATKDGKLTGTTRGGFFGPVAEEIGAVWTLSGPGENATGAFVGKK
ncbi:transferrin-binding protein-like solute binding protein [Iodidimonas sp. SYSU 1G8]|uniref:transferrin-binding protein-like solute binding protein n=1 Tax=Iodidimonas sp. SYSU 1G8 TaxID=3133967 RepID=UPI0031FEECFA